MKSTITSIYSQKKKTLPILKDMNVELQVNENPFDLSLDQLFTMAARVNKKRAFLFVSELLGKHIPVKPFVPLVTSGLLALLYAERNNKADIETKAILSDFLSDDDERLGQAFSKLKDQLAHFQEDVLVIGFAETATALGHGVSDMLRGSAYLHTTREDLPHSPLVTFEEEHSHAVDQLCYAKPEWLQSDKPVILVDDEITTGKTAINIINEMHSKFPRDEYTVLSILDWRSTDDRRRFSDIEKDLGITIRSYSLLTGEMNFRGKSLSKASYSYGPRMEDPPKLDFQFIDVSNFFRSSDWLKSVEGNQSIEKDYIHETGRFGLTADDHDSVTAACKAAGEYLRSVRSTSGKILCLGAGELMYLPMRMAAFMGKEIYFHSTTRSPIHPVDKEGYAIRNGFTFPNPENFEIQHFLYNIPKSTYEELFFFTEKPVSKASIQPIASLCEECGIAKLYVVSLAKGSDDHR
ncbi:phosphoribosyltransferase family protein [Halobacillus salinarum]|uniref:Phosphoribosyltransferase family protein n=1 Tax=Halobacillus salinarum TaxID=2932257 RepID=A0ABY4EJC5_9BACI|nr:phosphoribosyltransferase family protein [Halobacillus salinarum]UOQ43953.1 phosphoribosyltransferase family protein [Halobacillus salinarum]